MVLTMVYSTQNHWVLGVSPMSAILKNKTNKKLDPFSSSDEAVEANTLLSLLGRANVNHGGQLFIHCRKRTVVRIVVMHVQS
jgi:hypothetical protein